MSKNRVVFKNINQLMSLKGVCKKGGRKPLVSDLGIIKNAAMIIEDQKVLWVGMESKLPAQKPTVKTYDCQGKNMFPGFVDCHTHSVFAGDRRNEFELRNTGVSYQEIAARGGGILSTMKATRKASLEELTELGQSRVETFLSQGVTCLEIKSGYGLNRKTEMKMLQAAQSLKKARVVTTYLGAHAIPQGKTAGDYLETLKKDLVEIKNNKLSSRVDIFIEKDYFGIKESRDYLQYAKSLGFDVTIHADQLSRSGATRLAIAMEAKSADHVIQLTKKDLKSLADSQTVAVFLPAADFYLQCDYPKGRAIIDQGGSFALATDFNPGSSPTQNIQFVGVLARLKMQMSLPEVFVGLTYGGAKALGKENQLGALLPGYYADFFLTEQKWQSFFYDLKPALVDSTFVSGRKVKIKK